MSWPLPRLHISVAGVSSTYVVLALLFHLLWRFETAVGAVQLGLLVLFLTAVCGGTVAGYLTTESRWLGARNGAIVEMLAGILLGAVATFVLTAFSYKDPPPAYTVWETIRYFVLTPIAVGLMTGSVLSVGGVVGGWLGSYRRRTPATLDTHRRGN